MPRFETEKAEHTVLQITVSVCDIVLSVAELYANGFEVESMGLQSSVIALGVLCRKLGLKKHLSFCSFVLKRQSDSTSSLSRFFCCPSSGLRKSILNCAVTVVAPWLKSIEVKTFGFTETFGTVLTTAESFASS